MVSDLWIAHERHTESELGKWALKEDLLVRTHQPCSYIFEGISEQHIHTPMRTVRVYCKRRRKCSLQRSEVSEAERGACILVQLAANVMHADYIHVLSDPVDHAACAVSKKVPIASGVAQERGSMKIATSAI